MNHSTHTRLTETQLNAEMLDGATIYGPEDEMIGTVDHVHGSGADAQVVIDVGGFLGIGAKSVLVPVRQLDFMTGEDGVVHALTSWTKDDLKSMPEHIDRQDETRPMDDAQ
ncbi:PRC-barrel domain-containing protein [Paracoccus laeviglucosivorans]|uniref:PRC-barrel domain-containing protein n=1 Tax=Paracoccus laeviglucosivorans TaxID=1197861 RepID=A0A521FW68_9RHOB|nr:PRC-barrel domain-containing protein [Paracoccus laeviglucosivorans]SMP00151.1 PRC-barrel domain-containing protein [Paracoccus laeviglucosivorans]